MAFEVVSANEASVLIRDTVTHRTWQFLIVDIDGTRELSDTFQAGLDKDGNETGLGDEVPAFAFATEEALSRGLID